MSSFERGLIRERQMEGIRLRKEKQLYTGRRVGTVDSPERLLKKDKSKKIQVHKVLLGQEATKEIQVHKEPKEKKEILV